MAPADVDGKGPLTVTATNGITIGDGPAPVRSARSRAFSKAQRHSRLVRVAKVAIPLGALIAMAAVGAVAYLDPFRQIEGLSVGPISVSGTNVTMESPKLTGFRNDNRPYEVTASAATQDVRNPTLVELKDLKARIVTDDKGSAARLEAAIGILNTQKEQMNLRQDVRVRTDSGQEVLLNSAFVDFKAGTVVSDEPVTVTLGNGIIEATGLEVKDNGKAMHFKGRVRTTFHAASSESSASVPAEAGSESPPAQPTSVRP
ncbi:MULTISPECIES: LPS export ABC transporter periplasmic protein LptC [Microvirga]|uniref:LPS export ABC transporter periplasmic protein LptC n=1 Tax=Microvirga TaxID=186650 RepID=UPI001CFFC4B4|nr:LPS export ABC transporter periplasmic protein LptC [Microvirga lenta]MCB5174822.1 LPS export ABC transporter periplasmic protein LptC [Microvirga lenta]